MIAQPDYTLQDCVIFNGRIIVPRAGHEDSVFATLSARETEFLLLPVTVSATQELVYSRYLAKLYQAYRNQYPTIIDECKANTLKIFGVWDG